MVSLAKFDEWQAADGTPVLRFNAGELQVWNGAAWAAAGSLSVDYLVVAGGGGGGSQIGGGGGAGNVLEGTFETSLPSTFDLVIGAGGAGSTSNSVRGAIGQPSQLFDFRPVGGGGGGGMDNDNGGPGASSGGNARNTYGLPVTFTEQGNNGSLWPGGNTGGGGGGKGAAASGTVNGGAGISSSISGSSLFYAGGGGGNDYNNGPSLGGSGVGGDGGGNSIDGTHAMANRGGGGGAGGYVPYYGKNGGSGVVVFTVPTGTTVSFSAGVTQTSATVGSNSVYTVTATSTTSETVTIG